MKTEYLNSMGMFSIADNFDIELIRQMCMGIINKKKQLNNI